MIKIKLSEQLGKKRMSRRELAQLIGVRPNTIGDMYNDNVKRLDIATLNMSSFPQRQKPSKNSFIEYLLRWTSTKVSSTEDRKRPQRFGH